MMLDPWATWAAQVGSTSEGPSMPSCMQAQGENFKPKDFAHIDVFDGGISRFPNWADHMGAKREARQDPLQDVGDLGVG